MKRLTLRVDPETFQKMALRLADGWTIKSMAREIENRFPKTLSALKDMEQEEKQF